MKRLLLAVAISLSLTSCDGFWKSIATSRDPLIYPVENNTSNALRMDGYYYTTKKTDSTTDYKSIVFYRNGTLYGFVFTYDNIASMDNDMSVPSKDTIHSPPWFWGAYRILHNDTIQIQKWEHDDGTDPLNIYTSIILSDTSFKLTCVRPSKNLDSVRTINEVYIFRPLKTKRDSLNPYVPKQKN